MRGAGQARRPGASLLRLLLLAAVAGVVMGVVLAKVKERPAEGDLEAAELHSAALLPLGGAASDSDPMAPDPLSLKGLPAYPGAAPRRLMRSAAVQGVPMSVSWFETLEQPDDVLAYYEKTWAEEGRQYVSHRFSDGVGYAGWLEGPESADAGAAEGVLHMVSAIRQHAKTVVLLSASRPDLMMKSQSAISMPEGVALPPSAAAPQMLHMGEEGSEREVIFSRAVQMTPAAVVAFFEQQLTSDGWAVEKDAASPESLQGRRGSATVAIAIRPTGNDSALVLSFEKRLPSQHHNGPP